MTDHLARGANRRHRVCSVTTGDESRVLPRAARRAVPLSDLMVATASAESLDAAARMLGVPSEVLRTRIDHLHPSERVRIARAIAGGV